ncbi:MAG: hypothetical protein LBQ61_03275 [Spirochaetales bacterium]|nr:hypothetical protein [Spirochaetales bacterium]
MKKLVLILVLLPILLIGVSGSSGEVRLEIRYYDRAIYYTDSPIYVKVEITNNALDTYRFKLADVRQFSLDFSVQTLRHEELEHSDRYVMNRLTNRQVYFREISLEPGESYSFIEDLADFITLDQARQYRLQARFYPELTTRTQGPVLSSNILSLTVRPGGMRDEIADYIEEETGNILRAEALSPDQVVAYTIRARQHSQWEKFFLYLNVESLFLRQPINAERYRRASDAERRSLIEDYRNRLQSQTLESDLLLLPHEFRILRTAYTETEGTVEVLEKFRYSDFTELKQYTYRLNNTEGIWKITGYDVRNLGTE